MTAIQDYLKFESDRKITTDILIISHRDEETESRHNKTFRSIWRATQTNLKNIWVNKTCFHGCSSLLNTSQPPKQQNRSRKPQILFVFVLMSTTWKVSPSLLTVVVVGLVNRIQAEETKDECEFALCCRMFRFGDERWSRTRNLLLLNRTLELNEWTGKWIPVTSSIGGSAHFLRV